ncbi:glycosyltransferase family 4 protein [Cohnella fermenti]|uniref:Glycosyltransferase family 4 protein n=1 Tax=Cohnella fermenti TaxID=2565925 RepID=A0A4S4BZW8_9BACL|nr:glycosyltransferase family 4 protein [Cohnella fermenti]THF80835.1 glycosyltransferase family 4 protein [Cohnella fermenti]
MEKQLSKVDLRVFYFRAIERGKPDIEAPYLDVRLNYKNWTRILFYLKEKHVLKDFYDLYSSHSFDILHAHTLFSNGYIAYKANKRWGTPYIVAVRDVDLNVFFKYRYTLRELGLKILERAQKIVFLSSTYQSQLFSNYIPIKVQEQIREKCVIIPNGINDFYLNNSYSKERNINLDSLSILTVGYITKRKNQLAVCKAIQLLQNEYGINAKYTIVGKVLDGKVMKKINKYSFVNYIPFLNQKELIHEYRQADIYVMPSLTETFGLTYVEAMSQGLPVIYSKGQGFDNQFEEGMVGYHVRSKNVKEIAIRILDVIENYKEISRNCSHLSEKYNWSDISNEYIKIYKEIKG